MTNQIIVFKNEDGSCGIILPTEEGIQKLGMEGIAKKDVPTYRSLMFNYETENEAKIRLGVANLDDNLSYRITTKDEIPNDRYFRDAWEDNDKIQVCITKARAIHLNRLRVIRNAKLGKLDQDYMRADEENDPELKKEIVNKKKALRDLPNTIDLSIAKTLEELKIVMPDILK